jgi:mitochondrial pyruvate carrier 1
MANNDSSYSISGRMTGAFIVCSALLMRYSLAVRPKNYLLFAMHTVNVGAQSIQMMRFVNYW